jgi:hypothetical protein
MRGYAAGDFTGVIGERLADGDVVVGADDDVVVEGLLMFEGDKFEVVVLTLR